MSYQNKNSKSYFFNPECYFIQDYLCSYLNNNLNASEKKNLENHLKKCPSCSFEYESLIDFKREIQRSISDKDIQNLFQHKAKKIRYNKNKNLFDAILTIIFIIILIASITYLFLKIFDIASSYLF
jgi:predicted anti-sigma-YlaC factor YlaD